jgi:hypothetical protein
MSCLAAGGCVLDRAGAPQTSDGGSTADGGTCGPGRVDLNGNPADGCECAIDAEVCDGRDNDCDGTVDGALAEGCGSDRGECTRGVATCTGGVLGECVGEVGPTTEACDGTADEDCDGSVDEGCMCPAGAREPCGSDVGECTPGERVCTDMAWGSCMGGTLEQPELCNGRDDDCDGTDDNGVLLTFYRDDDGDGRGDPEATRTGCTAPAGFIATAGDCDDTCIACWAGASEICDGFDNDCDAGTPEASTVFYRDADGDTYGDPKAAMTACAMPAGYVDRAADCDDACAACNPAGVEICDALDNDCSAGPDDGIADCDCIRAARGGHDYLFCRGDFQRNEARMVCTRAGLDLVIIDNAGEQAWLEAQTSASLMDEWYIGLERTGTGAMEFEWVDGTFLDPGDYSNWRGPTPPFPPEPDRNGNCVRAFGSGHWGDTDCRNDYPSSACESY